ncbi:MBL fold metallo-hydrolase [Rhizobium sp. YIM 134829]|uniref:MBL fold metallo-hydrolase n=1 Tax=Rhizobium sp. YIM 134829 TaxID=3390453 RepID=UPI003978EC0A
MTTQLGLSEEARAPLTDPGDGTQAVLPELAMRTLSIVNVFLYGNPSTDGRFVLIDTGLPTSADTIRDCVERRFGRDARPEAIIMTHAHFDHAGSVESLSRGWDVPVYAHPLEHPYLNGQASYPPADPLVGGGVMALLSPLYPRSPVDVGPRLHMLPPDQSVPGMPGWQWVHTPGHTPGHVSLFRESDRTLIAGDAIVTTGQESAYAVMTQRLEMHGPPRYLTPDWMEAETSVRLLAGLKPELIVTGHGQPVHGLEAREKLDLLARDFREIAVPEGGHYDRKPAEPGKSENDAYR